MNIKRKLLFLIISLLMTFLLPNYANAALIFTFEAAGVQNTTVPPGVYNVETFDNGTAGSTIGTFSGSYQIKPATVWGGAGGNTKYAFCSNSNPLYLSFTQPVGYFGFWWSAGDEANILEITTADNVVRTYTTATLRNSGILTPNHFGNPNPAFLGQNKPQPYVFLNFFATDDKSKIKSITLKGSNFEADNYTTAAILVKPITGTPVVPGTCSTPQSAGTYPNCSCPDNKVLNTAGSLCIPPPIPTVTTQSVTVADTPIVITGKVDSTDATALATGETFSVSVNGVNKPYTLDATRKTWTVTLTGTAPILPVKKSPGYDVTATRNTINDTTSGELTVTAITCPTLEEVSATIPSYALSENGKKVTICHNTSSATNPFNRQSVAIESFSQEGHVNHGDYFTKSGACPTDAVPCPSLVCTAPYTLNAAGNACYIPDVIPTVTLGQTATDYAVPVITGGVFGTSTTLTITVENSATKVVTPIGTATKTSANGWTVTGTTNLAAGTYDVIATGDSGLVDNTPNELTVSPSVKPTVANKTTTDKVAVPLTGTAGSSTSLIITVKNASDTVVATSTTITPTGNNWTYTPPILPIGTYNVVATGDAAHGSLVDTSSGELVVSAAPIPTVTAMALTTDTTPVITGTVGNTGLSAGEAFSVKVNNVTYLKGNTSLVIGTTDWTLTIPTALNVGKYDVDAVRGTGTAAVADGTSQELEIIGTRPTVTNINQITNDTTPTILGTFGGTDLGANEAFSVTVNGIIYQLGDGNLTKGGSSTWTLTIPPANALKVGDYEVKAVRSLTLEDLSSTELHIVIKAPTVESQTVRERLPIVIKGTVGDVGLDALSTFTVLVNAKTYTYRTDAALAVSGMVWTLTIPTTEVFPPTTYEVVATRDGTLKDDSTGELIIEALKPPTVESQTTFDTTPIIKGTVGDAALSTGEVFTVLVNGVTYTNGDGKLVVSTLAWTLTIPTGNEITGRVAPYEVVATRGTGASAIPDTSTLELTISPCLLPKVVNAAGTECIDPTPTVVSQPALSTASTVTPTITGTVGEVPLGSTETFTVTIPTTTPQVYNKGDTALVISPTGTTWTLTVPAAKAIPVGTYDVEALRNTASKDKTAYELIVNLVCVAPQVPNTTRTNCVLDTTFPSANFLSTDDTTPVVTGRVGDVALDSSENFTVEINGVVYQKSQLTISGLTWSLEIPLANKLAAATYDVVVTRNGVDKDTTSNELTITSCNSPKRIDANTGDCSVPSTKPTVTPSASHNIKDSSIVVAGTVGDIPLSDNDSFTVTIHNAQHSAIQGVLLVMGTNWTFTLTEKFAGTFDVDAKRNSTYDDTSGELVITGNLCCINGATTQCPTTISVPDHAGECGLPICPIVNAAGNCTSPLPDSTKEETLPSQPDNTVPEAIVPPAELGYCDDGGKRSYGASMTGITIKRARIANAETIGGTFASNALVGMKVMFGTLTAGSYDDTDNSCQQGYCTNKTITGATLTDAIVDIATDYVDAVGNVIDNSNRGIALTGGVTNPTSLKKDGVTVLNATITNGMITAGTSDGNPVRGSITNGLFADAITHGTNALTKGRRTQGTLTNATITGATITTVDGVSVVGCDRSLDGTHTPCTVGVITSGTMATGVKTFGTVENGTLTNATITGSNHCFSSGTVGSKGQLNWKEVIK